MRNETIRKLVMIYEHMQTYIGDFTVNTARRRVPFLNLETDSYIRNFLLKLEEIKLVKSHGKGCFSIIKENHDVFVAIKNLVFKDEL